LKNHPLIDRLSIGATRSSRCSEESSDSPQESEHFPEDTDTHCISLFPFLGSHAHKISQCHIQHATADSYHKAEECFLPMLGFTPSGPPLFYLKFLFTPTFYYFQPQSTGVFLPCWVSLLIDFFPRPFRITTKQQQWTQWFCPSPSACDGRSVLEDRIFMFLATGTEPIDSHATYVRTRRVAIETAAVFGTHPTSLLSLELRTRILHVEPRILPRHSF